MPVKKDDWVPMQFRAELFRKAQKVAEELGPHASAAGILNQAADELFQLMDVKGQERRVPLLVRIVDGARSQGAVLIDEAPPRSSGERAAGPTKVFRAGKG